MYKANVFNILATKNAIANKYGEEESKNYIPNENCLTYNKWKEKGYIVRKGEKAISRIVTFISDKNDENKRFPINCCLFYQKQVDKIL
jgi:hypothetical protein